MYEKGEALEGWDRRAPRTECVCYDGIVSSVRRGEAGVTPQELYLYSTV